MTVSGQPFIKHFPFSPNNRITPTPIRKEVLKGLRNRSEIIASCFNGYKKKQFIRVFVFFNVAKFCLSNKILDKIFPLFHESEKANLFEQDSFRNGNSVIC